MSSSATRSDSWEVSRDHGIDVEDLVQKVKEKRFFTLKEVDSRMLTVYKLDGLTTNLKKGELEDHISKIDFSTASELKATSVVEEVVSEEGVLVI